MKKFLLSLIIAFYVVSAIAQVSFQQYQTPVGADDNYRLVVDYFTDNQILLPIDGVDTFYVRGSSGGFVPKGQGLYITAFYANNGDLYLVENIDTSGNTPKLWKSTTNGDSFTEITGVSGRTFHRDHRGNLFYSVSGGFAYSTDDGASFNTVSTSDSVYAVARDASGKLYYIADSARLYASTNDGVSWQNITRPGIYYNARERNLNVVNDTLYYQNTSGAYYLPPNDTIWAGMWYTSTSSLFTHLNISVDGEFFGYGPYGFFSTRTPYDKNWTFLKQVIGPPQYNIYNHYSAIADSTMYVFVPDSGYFYAPRIPTPVGIDDIVTQGELVTIYPNPTNGSLTILPMGINGEELFNIYDLQGRNVLSVRLTLREQTIDVSKLTPGLYLWHAGNEKGKLLVE